MNTLELEPLNKTADVNGSQHSDPNSLSSSDMFQKKPLERKSQVQPNLRESMGAQILRASGLAIGGIGTKSFYQENSPETPGTLTTSGAVLGIISTILGGGMVGIPWAIYSQGFVLGICVSAFASFQVTVCSVLYLKAREVCPDKPSSMFEIGYLIMGRSSIFAICFTIWINSFFLIVIFVSVFGGTARNVVVSVMDCQAGDTCGIYGESWLYMICIGALLLPTTFMKEIAELHLVSMSLFGAALLFVVINIFQIPLRSHKDFSNLDLSYSSYLWPTLGNRTEIINVINATTIVFTACNFQVNLFPIHSNSIDKTIKGTVKTVGITMFLVQAVYISLSTCVIFNYGSIINDDVLQNVGQSYPIECAIANSDQIKDNYPPYYVKAVTGNESVYPENYVMQFLFLIILACHIPYLFFSGKEALLIVIDEVMRQSISLTLSKKLLQENSEEIDAMPELPEDENTSGSRGASRGASGIRGTDGQMKIKQRGQSEIAGERFSEARQSMQNQILKVSARVTQKIEAALPDDLNAVNAQEATGLAYKTMPSSIYYLVTLVLYVVEVYVATLGFPISTIFGVIATFAGNGLSFFIPSLLVIIGFKKFAEKRYLQENGKWLTIAWVNFFLGVFFFLLFLGNNVLGFVFTAKSYKKGETACKQGDYMGNGA